VSDSIKIIHTRDAYGTTLGGTCNCGSPVETWVARDSRVSDIPGPFPDDIECGICGQWYNGCGQPINPRGDYDREVDTW
jgi:hypothetical protein